jgi:DNA mismatch repair protein MutH
MAAGATIGLLAAERAVETGDIDALAEVRNATASVAGKVADIRAAAAAAPATPTAIAEPGRTINARPRTHPPK